MSLLKWKKMAEKRSELGQRINEVRETLKQRSISDQMGQVEAAKLFKPITSGLRDLTAPKAPLRRLKKRGPAIFISGVREVVSYPYLARIFSNFN